VIPVLILASASMAQNSQQPAKSSGAPEPRRDYSFTVVASRVWTDTGLDLRPGELVHVTGGVFDCRAVETQHQESLPLPSARPGIVLMKVHKDGKPIPATPDGEVGIMDPSHLYLGVNGAYCTGSIVAKVHVSRVPAGNKRPQGR
jgi:hypothetical protein